MPIESIMELDNKVITEAQFAELQESEDVTEIKNYGSSFSHPGCTWYDVTLENGKDITIYFEFEV